MSSLVLRVISAAKQVSEFPLSQAQYLVAQTGASYQVVDAISKQPYGKVIVKKQGQALVIESDEQELLAQIEEFYAEGRGAAFDTGMTAAAGNTESIVISAASPAAEGSGIVWQAGQSSAMAAAELTG